MNSKPQQLKNYQKLILLSFLLLPIVSNAQTISDFGPTAHLTFDETTNDSVGTANATLYNSPSYVTSLQGHGIDLERSSSQYASINDQSSVRVDDGWSVSVWVNPESLNDYGRLINSRQSENCYGMLSYANGSLDVSAGASSPWCDGANVTSVLSPATWTHIVVTYNGASSYLYIDGTPDAISIPTITNPNQIVYIGSTGGASHYFDGVIDELSFFDYLLSDTDVTTIFNEGVPLCYDCETGTSTATSTATSTTISTDDTNFLLLIIIFFLSFIFFGLTFSLSKTKK